MDSHEPWLKKTGVVLVGGLRGVIEEKPLSPGDLKKILSEEGVSTICSLFHECPEGRELENLRQAYDGTKWESEDLLIEYESLFRVPGGEYVHPYESVYSVRTKTRIFRSDQGRR